MGVGVAAVDLVLQRRRNEDVAFRAEKLRVADVLHSLGVIILKKVALHGKILPDLGDIQALGAADAARNIADSNDTEALFMEQRGGNASHVAHALHRYGAAFRVKSLLPADHLGSEHHTATGSFASAERSAKFNGLAGDDAGNA